jgi:hypothetical protein
MARRASGRRKTFVVGPEGSAPSRRFDAWASGADKSVSVRVGKITPTVRGPLAFAGVASMRTGEGMILWVPSPVELSERAMRPVVIAAVHEAGHVVVARDLGLHCGRVWLDPETGGGHFEKRNPNLLAADLVAKQLPDIFIRKELGDGVASVGTEAFGLHLGVDGNALQKYLTVQLLVSTPRRELLHEPGEHFRTNRLRESTRNSPAQHH